MSEPIRGVVVAHADLASAVVRVVEQISGITDALLAVSNDGLGAEGLQSAITAALGSGPTILFVDLGGGSCGRACLGLSRISPEIVVLTGVNVPMLLDFVFHRDLEPSALADRLLAKGRTEQRILRATAPDGEP